MIKIRLIIASLIAISAFSSASAKNKATESDSQVNIPDYSQYILTPPAPETPRINSAMVFGVRPGAEILYTIAATGVRPMIFSAEGLPQGVTLDSKSGRISGKVSK